MNLFMNSLYIHCLNCYMWGTPFDHKDGTECGNCNSKDTIAYYPISRERVEKLLAVAKAVSVHINVWQKFAKINRSTKDLLGTRFDPAYKPEQGLGLKEALEELEKE